MPLGSWEHHGDLELARDNEMELMKLVLLGQGQNVHLPGAQGTDSTCFLCGSASYSVCGDAQ